MMPMLADVSDHVIVKHHKLFISMDDVFCSRNND